MRDEGRATLRCRRGQGQRMQVSRRRRVLCITDQTQTQACSGPSLLATGQARCRLPWREALGLECLGEGAMLR